MRNHRNDSSDVVIGMTFEFVQKLQGDVVYGKDFSSNSKSCVFGTNQIWNIIPGRDDERPTIFSYGLVTKVRLSNPIGPEVLIVIRSMAFQRPINKHQVVTNGHLII